MYSLRYEATNFPTPILGIGKDTIYASWVRIVQVRGEQDVLLEQIDVNFSESTVHSHVSGFTRIRYQ